MFECVDKVVLGVLIPRLDAPSLAALSATCSRLRAAISEHPAAWRVKRLWAAEHRLWKWNKYCTDAQAVARLRALVAAGQHCLRCGSACWDIRWPPEWSARFHMPSAVCRTCFEKVPVALFHALESNLRSPAQRHTLVDSEYFSVSASPVHSFVQDQEAEEGQFLREDVQALLESTPVVRASLSWARCTRSHKWSQHPWVERLFVEDDLVRTAVVRVPPTRY